MKKFEEELKRPVIDIRQSSIKPSLGKAIEFYTDKVKEYHNAFNEMNKYIDGLEAQLDYYKKDKRFEEMAEEILSLKSQLEKQQPEIPEVPQFVADWYEKRKDHLEYHIWRYIRCWCEHEKDDFYNFMNGVHSNPIEILIGMKNGYTVAKEKRFYLKAKELLVVGDYDHVEDLWLDFNKNYTPKKSMAHKFTQKEIDSMETGSYEQILIEEKHG